MRIRRWSGAVACAVLVISGITVSAAPAVMAKPKPPELRVQATVADFSAEINYTVNTSAKDIRAQSCTLTDPSGTTAATPCDSSAAPDPSKSRLTNKQASFSITLPLTVAGEYTYSVEMTFRNGSQAVGEATFTILPGAAVRFQITGVVNGVLSVMPPAQVATVTALDTYGNVATGYTGTVRTNNPKLPERALVDGKALFAFLYEDMFEYFFTGAGCQVGLAPNGACYGFYVSDVNDSSIEGAVQAGFILINIPPGVIELGEIDLGTVVCSHCLQVAGTDYLIDLGKAMTLTIKALSQYNATVEIDGSTPTGEQIKITGTATDFSTSLEGLNWTSEDIPLSTEVSVLPTDRTIDQPLTIVGFEDERFGFNVEVIDPYTSAADILPVTTQITNITTTICLGPDGPEDPLC